MWERIKYVWFWVRLMLYVRYFRVIHIYSIYIQNAVVYQILLVQFSITSFFVEGVWPKLHPLSEMKKKLEKNISLISPCVIFKWDVKYTMLITYLYKRRNKKCKKAVEIMLYFYQYKSSLVCIEAHVNLNGFPRALQDK